MAKTDEVPVFYRDQDASVPRPHTVWLRSKCREQRKLSGEFIDNGKAFRLYADTPRTFSVTASCFRDSNILDIADTISLSETLANVGIAGHADEPAPRHTVKNAQRKIRAYPHIRDRQAPLAYGRWYASEGIQVTAQA